MPLGLGPMTPNPDRLAIAINLDYYVVSSKTPVVQPTRLSNPPISDAAQDLRDQSLSRSTMMPQKWGILRARIRSLHKTGREPPHSHQHPSSSLALVLS